MVNHYPTNKRNVKTIVKGKDPSLSSSFVYIDKSPTYRSGLSLLCHPCELNI